jgi:glucose dehydrogenase
LAWRSPAQGYGSRLWVGSLFYVVAGLGILITGVLLMAGRRAALWVYAAVLIGTLIWAVSEVGLDWWPLAARGDVIFPLGLWLLTPWITRNLNHDAASSGKVDALPLWGAVVACLGVLVVSLSLTYHEIDGAIAAVAPAPTSQNTLGMPDEGTFTPPSLQGTLVFPGNLGGPMTTAGGVAFLTSTMDYYIRAYDVTDGKQLWEDRLPAGAQSTPMSYAIDGKQYVVTAAGGHGSFGTKSGDDVIAYALAD